MNVRRLGADPSVAAERATRVACFLLALVVWWLPGLVLAQSASPAGIASAHPLASDAGQVIMKQGGNAFDAAVAISAALAVVEPASSGFGGGAYFLLHRAADGFQIMVDARETAPGRAHAGMFLDGDGRPIAQASLTGTRSAGIPGMPAGLVHLAEKYGRLPLAASLAPAIRLAREGFPVDERYVRLVQLRQRTLADSPDAARIFLLDGKPPPSGYLLRNVQLAQTMESIAAKGLAGFYAGPVAAALVKAVQSEAGIWELSDLSGYKVVERPPVRFTYGGARITTAALSSGGGVTLAQALNILEQFRIGNPREPASVHLIVEAMRRAFQDRNNYLGDTDFVSVPVARLTEKGYARSRAASIERDRATRSIALGPSVGVAQGVDTTHFSVIDAEGNRVAATLSINHLFGSGIVAAGTGVLLNNEMDDFTVLPGLENAYRLKSGAANAIAPGKRPLSSMTPTFIEDDKGVLVLGAPGGSRIISQVLLAILDYVHSAKVDLPRIAAAPRYHHQFSPDQLEIEPGGFDAAWVRDLEGRGHVIRRAGRLWGNLQVVFRDRTTGEVSVANDPRGNGVAWY